MKNNVLVVSDTGPIITLCKIDKLDILHNMFDKIFIPKAVYDELNSTSYPKEVELVNNASFIFVSNVNNITEVQKIIDSDSSLHRGEVEAIILAEEIAIDSKRLIIDDMKARSYAEMRGIYTVGAIGIMAQAIREGYIKPNEVELCIKTMKENNRFYNESLYDVLRKAASSMILQKEHTNKLDDKQNLKSLTKEFVFSKKHNKDFSY